MQSLVSRLQLMETLFACITWLGGVKLCDYWSETQNERIAIILATVCPKDIIKRKHAQKLFGRNSDIRIVYVGT